MRELPEIKELLAKFPKYVIDAEGINAEKGHRVVHVYYQGEKQTATYNYYFVDLCPT